jgi:hypothetical protein
VAILAAGIAKAHDKESNITIMPKYLPPFHPDTLIRGLGGADAFCLSDAVCGCSVMGATGSGKTSGPGKYLAYGYLSNGFGGIVLSAKKDVRHEWEQWAEETGRTKDLIIIDKKAAWRCNFLDWEASRPGEGGGLGINITALLDEVSGVIAGSGGKSEGGDGQFFKDALHHLNGHVVDSILLSGLPVSLPLMHAMVTSAPQSLEEASSDGWKESSVCAAVLREADLATRNGNEDARADFEECREYWQGQFAGLSDRTRSICVLMFSMMVRPFITGPLRRLFATDTNITPEATFDGKIILIDLPVQEYRLAGKAANLVWKYITQVAILRRIRPLDGSYLRPVFIYADEAQNFISDFDAEYQAVARSAGGCTVYMTQNRESYLRVLGNPNAVDALLGNLQNKFFCQNAGETNEWAAKLLGERWLDIASVNFGNGGDAGHTNSGASIGQQRRYFVEPARFATLRRGGEFNGFQVEAVVYKGGSQFLTQTEHGEELLPYKLLAFQQR